MNSTATKQGIRLGIRAHDLGCFPADELAQRTSAGGFECVQLALSKAIPDVDPESGVMDGEWASRIASAFTRRRVRIEVLGCYINPIHPDPEIRRSLRERFIKHLRHARAFGCGIVALESGSLNGDYSPHPGNHGEEAFQQLVREMRGLVTVAEDRGVVIGMEAVTSHVVSTPEKLRRLLDEIDSPHLKVVFDPVNLLNLDNFIFQCDVLERSLELLGDDILVVHAKDFRVSGDCFQTCPAGSGMLDYDAFLPWIDQYKPGIAILLEEAGPEAAAASRDFLLQAVSPNIS